MNYFFKHPISSPSSKYRKTLHAVATAVNSYVKDLPAISSAGQYNQIIHDLVKKVSTISLTPPSQKVFKTEIDAIAQGKPLTEKVVWGGVTLKKVDVEKDFIRKLLVINRLGILGFEIHRQKLEKLRVIEGFCLVVYSNHAKNGWKQGMITLKAAGPGDKFVFQPNDEHGIIALTNCVIEESSTNHLDDLVYIFPSQQVLKH